MELFVAVIGYGIAGLGVVGMITGMTLMKRDAKSFFESESNFVAWHTFGPYIAALGLVAFLFGRWLIQ